MGTIRAGETVRLYAARVAKAPSLTKPHLWLILTDPYGQPPRVVAVMVVTKTIFTDDTVVLNQNDHPYFDRDSAVDFGSARLFDIAYILKSVVLGAGSFARPMSKELLRRVQDGLLKSPHAVPAIARFCRDRWAE
jgi:hypothetical protein